MLGLRGGINEDIAEITELSGIKLAWSEYVSHAAWTDATGMFTSDEAC